MAVPLVGVLSSQSVSSILQGLLGSAAFVYLINMFKSEKTKEQFDFDKIPAPKIEQTPSVSLVSLMSERNQLLYSQNLLLSSLIDVIKANSLATTLSMVGNNSFSDTALKSLSNAFNNVSDKAKDENKEGFKPNISAGDTVVKDVPQDLAKPDIKPSVDNVALRSIASAVDNLGKAQLANNELISAMNATAINNSQRVANAITSGKMTAEVKNNVKVQNDVVIRRLEAELSVNKPVEVSLPAEVMAYNKSMLEQKIKEVENSTKTYEIYKEQDTYQKTAQNIADLDGKTITNATPRDVALQYQATRARTATDVNSFELDDTDIDTLFGNLPDITKIFNFTLPSEIDKEFSN
ncbi:hypothetical protein ACPF04_05185 [Campylobacter sp. MOP51]|uniref:hypothetical protein n=1 Tax=Campylobacter canis TaxID=3378588 RepID=UPI003C42E00D